MSEEALKENKMGVMPMPKLMLSMGLPMIISMIVQAFYNIVDSYFVSRITDDTVEHIGEYAVNALTLASCTCCIFASAAIIASRTYS